LAQAEKAELKRIETLEHFNKNRETVIAEIKTALDSQEFGKATALLTEYRFVDDSTIHAIEAELQEKIAEAERAKKTTALLAELASAAESDLDKRMGLTKNLLDLHPGNEEYIKATDFYAHRIAEENEKKRTTEERKKKLGLQFSVWDGSHRTLEKLIKATMNDPRSYEHVETVYWDMEEHLIVRTTFRGKNIYGGVVPNWVKAKIDLDGNIIEVIETYP